MIGAALAAVAALAGGGCLDAERRSQLVVLTAPGGELTAVIDPAHGAELVGLERGGRELLYRGMNFCPVSGWDGKAPVLWPATGRNYAADPAGGEAAFGWTSGGRRYPMPVHGFARDRVWRVTSRTASSATLELSADEKSRTFYPFGFRFQLRYTLRGDTLTLDHTIVSARNQPAMPFSIGNHITFAVSPGAAISTRPGARVTLDASGRPLATVPQPAVDRAPVASFAKLEAVSLSGYLARARATLDLGDGTRVVFSQRARGPRPVADPVRYNLWGDPAAGFFAVEPWYGRQNALAEGKGVVSLAPGRTFDWQLSIRIAQSTPSERN